MHMLSVHLCTYTHLPTSQQNTVFFESCSDTNTLNTDSVKDEHTCIKDHHPTQNKKKRKKKRISASPSQVGRISDSMVQSSILKKIS